MRVCDVCKNPAHQPVSRASIHVRNRSSGALDLCDECLATAAANRSASRSKAAIARLKPWVPRELTDSEDDAEVTP